MMEHAPSQDPLEIAEEEMGGNKPKPDALEEAEEDLNPMPTKEDDPRVRHNNEELDQLP